MNKKLIALAVAGVISGYGTAVNAVEVSGFTVVKYVLTDDSGMVAPATTNANESKFSANGEIDFTSSPADGVTVRMDVDLDLTTGSGQLEQAFFAWSATDSVTVIGGVFNNPIGYEAEDKPDMIFNNHGAVYTVLDGQTVLDGDNVAGLAVAGAVGPVTLTGAFLNDISGANEENSIAFIANYSPIEGLDLEVGLVTQDAAAENVTNFNIVYTGVKGLEVGLDYLTADEMVDSAYDLWAGYSVGGGFAVNLRISEIEYSSSNTTETTAFNASYKIASNLKAILELQSTDTTVGATTADSDLTTLKFVATF
ncbi:MAG: hypothetical protein COB71_08465 [Thiotrichales bacterium]|nr:MAG: hypothetical protein COB71_08465 [Thiotrichales bacterium]